MITFVRVQPFKTRQNCYFLSKSAEREWRTTFHAKNYIFRNFDAVKYTPRDAEQREGGEGGI